MAYKHMTIDALATALEACCPDATVVADGNPIGYDTGSYRGYYERLYVAPAANPERPWGDAPVSASDLAERLRRNIGETLQGYKGGDFVMFPDTLVHCAEYGRSGPMIIGVVEHKDKNEVELILCEEAF